MSFTPCLFKNFGKAVSDFFDAEGKNNKFNSGRNSVVVRSSSSNGLTLTHSSHVTGANVASDLKLAYKNAAFGSAEATGSADSTKTKLKLNKLHAGVEVELNGEFGKKQKAEATVTYVKDAIAASIKAGLLKPNTVEASVAVGVDNISVGAQVNLGDVVGADQQTSTGVTDYNGAFQYEQKDLTVSLVTAQKADQVNLSVNQVVNSDVTVHAAVSYNFSAAASANNSIATGASIALDSTSSLKAKVAHNGDAAFNYEHLFRSYAKLNVASTFNVTQPRNAAFGVSLTLGQTSE